MKNETFSIQNTITVEMESRNFYVGVAIRKAMRRFNALQVTRQQFAEAIKQEMPWAFIHVGGCHVAIHNRKDEGRDALVTSVAADWN